MLRPLFLMVFLSSFNFSIFAMDNTQKVPSSIDPMPEGAKIQLIPKGFYIPPTLKPQNTQVNG